ncbi:ArsC/Spx/MgsR family protein [Candidatus Thalassolituus haligoni]|uniref:ArsC/Spx/MgsR family protein n=1 Tax=Candidatus Thalassolituus haligoni TaxID=3100113 RepID=UPI0035143365
MLHFYEKPGCINNTRQKKILREAGVDVVEHNLLTTPWQAQQLRRFFDSLPVSEWFNRSAPAVKNGQIDPEHCTAEQAMAAMIAEPLLIRRPLIQLEGWYHCGFDWPRLQQQLGLGARSREELDVPDDIEGCASHHASGKSCTVPGSITNSRTQTGEYA